MADLSTVRTEIKAWERTFKSINGRDPSIQDIREQPAIEEKYRLYKKLSKAAAGTTSVLHNHAKSSDPPTTPLRSQRADVHSALLLSIPRAIEKVAPLSSFNPFSPQKNKGKQKEPVVVNKNSRANPFATPTKAKAKPLVQKRDVSPDLFPPIQASTSNFAPAPPPPAPTNAIARARKRLRGEPVSPSPNKEKRRRVDPPIIPMQNVHQSISEDDEDAEATNSSFVDDSPVKAPPGGKSFKLLFEETVAPQNNIPVKKKGTLARSKTIPASMTLFGEHSERNMPVSARIGDDLDCDLRIRSRPKDNRGKKSVNGKSFTLPNRIAPGKDDLFSEEGPLKRVQPLITSKPSKAGPSITNPVDSRTSTKRSLSDTEIEPKDILTVTANPIPPLLPPSPPPAYSSFYRTSTKYNSKSKGVARTKTTGRKKAKVVSEDEEDEDTNVDEDEAMDGMEHNVKLVNRTQFQGVAGKETRDLDLDPILGYAHHGIGAPHGNHPSTQSGPTMIRDVNENRTGTFEVDLPDKFRRVLALSPSGSRTRDSREERVFRGLLYGQRASNYDPVKGGEIWDVGEEERRCNRGGEEEGEGTTEGEDDWEGEPVPWEVGEL